MPVVLVDGELRGDLKIAFFDNNKMFRQARTLENPKLEPIGEVRFPLDYMQSFRPINLQLELPIKNQAVEDDLDIDYGLSLNKEALVNDPQMRERARLREYKKRLMVEYNPKVFLSLQI